MSTMEKFDDVCIHGPLALERLTEKASHRAILVILMGSTGSGKSSFIESLCPGQGLSISSDSLESVTQEVTAYKLVNASWWDEPIILIDTPGFSDTKISEAKIVRDVQKWIADNNSVFFQTVIFFQRITDTRVTHDKRRLYDMFKVLTGLGAAQSVTVVTTMWNQIWTDGQRNRAENRYQQLRDNLWKDLLAKGGKMSKFDMSRTSALEILGRALVSWFPKEHTFLMAASDSASSPIEDAVKAAPTFPDLLRANLTERISSLQLQLRSIEVEMNMASLACLDGRSKQRLRSEHNVLCALLQEFQEDLALISAHLPTPTPDEEVHDSNIDTQLSSPDPDSPALSVTHSDTTPGSNIGL